MSAVIVSSRIVKALEGKPTDMLPSVDGFGSTEVTHCMTREAHPPANPDIATLHRNGRSKKPSGSYFAFTAFNRSCPPFSGAMTSQIIFDESSLSSFSFKGVREAGPWEEQRATADAAAQRTMINRRRGVVSETEP